LFDEFAEPELHETLAAIPLDSESSRKFLPAKRLDNKTNTASSCSQEGQEMNLWNESSAKSGQPALDDLFRAYLNRQAKAESAGLAATSAQGEVIPHDAAPDPSLDPQLAWDDATAVASHFVKNVAKLSLPAPADWLEFISAHEPVAAVTFSFGNFPQLVRDLRSLLDAERMSSLRCTPSQPSQAPALEDWVAALLGKNEYPLPLLAVGLRRFARQFDQAEEALQRCQPDVPAPWRAAWANEEAALEWHRGREDRAIDLWKSQAPSTPALFNRGMAALFQDRPAEARTSLSAAISSLPEDSGWYHLGRLYLALAETRA
jgi:tetratricopeptide (TPR) repeat protein